VTYYLYVKTHNKTGLKYLGQTSSKNPHEYKGSGTRWINHIKKHGYDVYTEILVETDDKNAIKQKGIEYSNHFNVVESSEWANLKIEEGDGGWSTWNKTKEAHAARLKGAKRGGGKRSTSFKAGDPKVKELSEKANQTKENMIKENPRIFDESYKKVSEYQKKNNSMKNKCWCVKKNAKDYSGRKVFDKNCIPKGWVTVAEHRENNKDKSNSAYGKMWIHNPNTKQNKYISKEEKIPCGWVKGRKMEYYKV